MQATRACVNLIDEPVIQYRRLNKCLRQRLERSLAQTKIEDVRSILKSQSFPRLSSIRAPHHLQVPECYRKAVKLQQTQRRHPQRKRTTPVFMTEMRDKPINHIG